MVKAKSSFMYVLAIVSILGFLTTALDSFGHIDINNYVKSLIFVVIGIGLMIEGNIRLLPKMLRHGLTSAETTHILAITIGLFAVVSGFLSMPFMGLENETFTTLKGVLSVFAIIIIIVETWLVR